MGLKRRIRVGEGASIMPCKYTSSLGPPGIECINPLMHMGPVKLDSARFSWKCDISVSTEFQTILSSLSLSLPFSVCVCSSMKLVSTRHERTVKRCYSRGRLMSIPAYTLGKPFSIDAMLVLNTALIQKFTIIRTRRSRASHLHGDRVNAVLTRTDILRSD